MNISTFAAYRNNNNNDFDHCNANTNINANARYSNQEITWSHQTLNTQENENLQFKLQNIMAFGNNFSNNNVTYSIENNNACSLSQVRKNIEGFSLQPSNSDLYYYTQLLQQQQQEEEHMKQNLLALMPECSTSVSSGIIYSNGDCGPSPYDSTITHSSHHISTPNTSLSSTSPDSQIFSLGENYFQNVPSNGKSSIEDLVSASACQPQLMQQRYTPASTKSIQFPIFPEEFFNVGGNVPSLSSFDTSNISFGITDDVNTTSSTLSPFTTPEVTIQDRRASVCAFPVGESSPKSSSTSPSESFTSSSLLKRGSSSHQKYKKPKTEPTMCLICGKTIRRDITRHLRTHEPVARFGCVFPHQFCRHKTGQFNRPYDFKKHLLNSHFKFDDPNIKKLHNLNDKLEHVGTCSCGLKFRAVNWLRDHVLTDIPEMRCPYTSQVKLE